MVEVAAPTPEHHCIVWHHGAMDGAKVLDTTFPSFSIPLPYHDMSINTLPVVEPSRRTIEEGHEEAHQVDGRVAHRGDGHDTCPGKQQYNNNHPMFSTSYRSHDDHNDDVVDYRRSENWHGRVFGARYEEQELIY